MLNEHLKISRVGSYEFMIVLFCSLTLFIPVHDILYIIWHHWLLHMRL